MRRPRPADLCVIGLGYIGLPSAVVFARAGLRVTGVDLDPARVGAVNLGEVPTDEPGLAPSLSAAVAAGRLRAGPRPVPADAFLIAVPTPLGPGRTPDLSAVRAASDALAVVLRPGDLVVLESTVPPGTTEGLAAELAAARPDLSFPPSRAAGAVRIAHCPERVLPGRILAELSANDRIVGGLTPDCAAAAARLFARAAFGRCHLTDARTAETAKLAENAYRDVNIAFANELDRICEVVGVDTREMIRLANRHPRVGILDPGPGVGGHCIAVDPWFLAAAAPARAPMIRAARRINDDRPAEIAARAVDLVTGLARPAIACFGLAYKADVDDLRQSPAVEVCRRLSDLGLGPVLAVEPALAADTPLPGLGNVRLVQAEEALAAADLAILLVGHRQFERYGALARASCRVLDTRGTWTPSQAVPAPDVVAREVA